MTDPKEDNKVPAHQKSILIVDDDASIRSFMEILLSREGFRVETIVNGTEALRLLNAKTLKVDLVVLDLMMPGRGGYDVLKELQSSRYKNVPIFVVTARVLDEGTVEMIRSESNVKDFWTKPVDVRKFKQKVHDVLGTIPASKPKAEWEWQG